MNLHCFTENMLVMYVVFCTSVGVLVGLTIAWVFNQIKKDGGSD